MNVQFRNFVPADLYTVKKYLPYSMTETTTGVVAYDKNTNETLAILLAENWSPTSVTAHQVILKPMVLRHGWFEEIANYIFTKAARKKIFGLVPENNWKALNVNEKCGFKEVCRLEDAYDEGIDFILMELRREDCPYWKQQTEEAAA